MGTPGPGQQGVRTQQIARARPSLKTGAIDFQEKWSELREDLMHVLTNPSDCRPERVQSERHYDMVYKLCTFHCKNIPVLPKMPPGELREGRPAPQLLYAALKCFLEEHVEGVARKVHGHGPEVLSSYLREWTAFRLGMDYTHAVFHYLNRDWVSKQTTQGKSPPGAAEVHEVRTLGYMCWRECLYQRVRQQLVRALLEQIEFDRKGGSVQHGVMKGTIQSIVALGLDQRKPNQFYTEQFENKFLRDTEAFYTKEVAEILMRDGGEQLLPDYMQHVERRLDEETRRLHQFLNPSSEKGLMRTLVRVTIEAKSNMLLEASRTWFDEDRVDEQRRLFRLLERSDGGLEPLRKLIEDRIDSDGKNAIEKVRAEAVKDPCVYVETILQVYDKYLGMVRDIFKMHEHFRAALDKGCRRFINKNCLATQSGAKSAELLAKYAHLLLKPTSKAAKVRSEEELDQTLNQVLTIFKLLEDKDVFQKFYSTMLSRRLIQNAYSQDQEAVMISKLKESCGYEYTYKLQRMFTDMQLSVDITKAYGDWMTRREQSNTAPELTAYVLTCGSWPLSTPKTGAFEPPDILNRTLENFGTFYKSQHNGRKLTWLHNHANGMVRTNYPLPKQKNYELTVSTYQCAVLLAFNSGEEDHPRLSWQALLSATKLDDRELEFACQVLCKFKVMIAEGTDDQAASLRGRAIGINPDFQPPMRKLQLHTVQPREVASAEDTATVKAVAEDRRYAIQAAIVRIMKSRKSLAHSLLIAEVTEQLKGKFAPAPQDVKKNIDNLIEKEYMERGPDGKSYQYQA
eukprot:TRINITY_DN66136_c0_g1_i1.p1 TRINITY_DN66136_c0_g1~~TRINITY_DN66136_c0_g1_i1.p1  ORF type:complete len:829 (+),score=325.05 TRINITY_DN66136_c0_g1_i1:100-2487(+)